MNANNNESLLWLPANKNSKLTVLDPMLLHKDQRPVKENNRSNANGGLQIVIVVLHPCAEKDMIYPAL